MKTTDPEHPSAAGAMGCAQRVQVGDLEIAYDTFGAGEPVLLIMGIGAQGVMWERGFCEQLASEGFQVIRYDNRDVGHSSKLDALGRVRLGSALGRRFLGRPIAAPYDLDDMAKDAAGLLEALGHESAHVVGISFGGMIAQCLALKHPGRVRSLGLLMTNSGEVWWNVPRYRALAALLSRVSHERDAAIARQVRLFRELGYGEHRSPESMVVRTAAEHFDRGVFPRGFARQFGAMLASGGRIAALGALRVPTLVFHGSRDPLVPPAGGRFMAAAIPGARFELIRDLGHDFSPSVWPAAVRALVANARSSRSVGPWSAGHAWRVLVRRARPV